MLFDTQTGTPPSALDIVTTPEKSTMMKWSMVSPVSSCTAVTVHDGPHCSEVLIDDWKPPPLACVVGSVHRGSITWVSRGIDITVALERSADRWTTISTSAFAPAPQSPPRWQSAALLRVSEPMIRMLTGERPYLSTGSADCVTPS